MRRSVLFVVAFLTLLIAACNGEPSSVVISGVNYAYEDVPERLAVGSDLTFRNDATDEVHEMIVVRIDDAETRSVEELLNVPEEEVQALITDVGVSVALPGEAGIVVEGSDPIVLDQAGRYALICFLPVGSDVEAARALLAGPPTEGEGPPPSLGEGPPHFTQGMVSEFTVS